MITVEKINDENLAMLKKLENVYILLKEGKRIKAPDIRTKTGLDLKYWTKLLDNHMIINLSKMCSKPIYIWNTSKPTIHTSDRLLKETYEEKKEILDVEVKQNETPVQKIHLENRQIKKEDCLYSSDVYRSLFNKNDIEKFVLLHYDLCKGVFNEICSVSEKKMLVRMARNEMNYSDKTVSVDILKSLNNCFDRLPHDAIENAIRISQHPVFNIKEITENKELKKSNHTNNMPPATIEQIREYCNERKNNVLPEKFLAHYQSNGWMVGKTKMKDWKASIRYWESQSGITTKSTTPQIDRELIIRNLDLLTIEDLIDEIRDRGGIGKISMSKEFVIDKPLY